MFIIVGLERVAHAIPISTETKAEAGLRHVVWGEDSIPEAITNTGAIRYLISPQF